MRLLPHLIRTAPRVYPEFGWREQYARLKYCVRGLLTPFCTQRWFALLERPELTGLTRAHPFVFSKLQRPYLRLGLPTHGRLAVLQAHYGFVAERLSAEAREQVLAGPGVRLTGPSLDETGRLGLWLVHRDLEKEGDLSLCLREEDAAPPLFILTFCLAAHGPHSTEAFIGGLQGRRARTEPERVRLMQRVVEVTRAMHGLRPKALLLFALQQLAQAWRVTRLRAVGDATHVYRSLRKRRTIAASYDEFWSECGGQRTADGSFDLPLIAEERDLSGLKPTKRALYRRRYAWLDEVAREIRQTAMAAASAGAGRSGE